MPTFTITDAETGEVRREIPACDLTDPADLEAWYGNYGYDEKFRKVVLANCRAVARAKQALVPATVTKEGKEKLPTPLSDPRADDVARQSDMYLDYLIAGLKGRKARERNVIDSQRS